MSDYERRKMQDEIRSVLRVGADVNVNNVILVKILEMLKDLQRRIEILEGLL